MIELFNQKRVFHKTCFNERYSFEKYVIFQSWLRELEQTAESTCREKMTSNYDNIPQSNMTDGREKAQQNTAQNNDRKYRKLLRGKNIGRVTTAFVRSH